MVLLHLAKETYDLKNGTAEVAFLDGPEHLDFAHLKLPSPLRQNNQGTDLTRIRVDPSFDVSHGEVEGNVQNGVSLEDLDALQRVFDSHNLYYNFV